MRFTRMNGPYHMLLPRLRVKGCTGSFYTVRLISAYSTSDYDRLRHILYQKVSRKKQLWLGTIHGYRYCAGVLGRLSLLWHAGTMCRCRTNSYFTATYYAEGLSSLGFRIIDLDPLIFVQIWFDKGISHATSHRCTQG